MGMRSFKMSPRRRPSSAVARCALLAGVATAVLWPMAALAQGAMPKDGGGQIISRPTPAPVVKPAAGANADGLQPGELYIEADQLIRDDHAKVTTAKVQVRALETALQTMELDIGRYPTEGEGLALLVQGDRKAVAGWTGPYLASGVPLDPWGHPYVYEPPTDAAHAPKVHSLGSDGKPGGEGLAADIYNNSGT